MTLFSEVKNLCMDHNNMLREPNEKNQPSVFQFEAYPGPSNVYSWNGSAQDPKYMNSPAHYQSSPIFSNLQVSSAVTPQIPAFTFRGSTNSSQFPFHITNNGFSDQRVRLTLGKRKTDSPPLQPCKQHITEEKMAEHMSKLHISSETVTSPLEPESVKHKRLYMCEEMRKLQTEPLLPAALVSHIQRPCTALVLWQPPPRVLPILSTESSSSSSAKDEPIEDTADSPINKNLELVDMDNEFGGTMDLDS